MIEKITKYNLWGNNTIPHGQKREDYTQELCRYTGNSLIKVLVGQRRSGKSYILRQMAHHLTSEMNVKPENTLFINVEFFDSEMERNLKTLETLYAEYREQIAPEGKAYRKYIHEGGLPELQNLPTADMRTNYMQSLRDTVMLRDIVSRYKIKDVGLLSDIFTYLVNNASSIVSICNIVNYFNIQKHKTNYETVSSYIKHLEQAFLVHRAVRYNIRGKVIISGNAKYYINDLAFRNFLYRGFGYEEGYLLENAVYLELRRRGYTVYVGNNGQKEVDFVAIKNDETMYVQVSLELNNQETLEREYSSLHTIPDHFKKVVVTIDQYTQPLKDGIENIQAWTF